MKKLLILDSNSILNRAYYGIRFLSAPDGTPTNAIYGFLNILFKLISDEKPDYICGAFDLKAPTFRHKMYDGYKAQRKPMPDDLKVQMPYARKILSAMGIPVLEVEGYEADDIIGTVSRICDNSGIKCLIATGDKDDLQLVSENTNVILTISRMGQSETVCYGIQEVYDKYNVTPEEFIDVKALMGDPSDNIPGVAGVGEKTAIKLISEFHTIENLYQNLAESGVKGAMLQKLTDGHDSAVLSKELATICTSVPIDFSVDDCLFNEQSLGEREEFTTMLESLALNSFIKRIGGAKPKKNIDFFKKLVKADNFDFGTDEIACLIKTNKNRVISIALSDGKNVFDAYGDEAHSVAKQVIENELIKKYMFDIKSDYVALKGEIEFKNIVADLSIGAYLLNPEKSEYTIFGVLKDYLGVEPPEEKSENTQLSLFDESDDFDAALQKQAFCILPLWNEMKQRLENGGLYKLFAEIEMPLIYVLGDMEYEGITVDKDELEAFGNKLNTDISRLTEEIYSLAGEEFNINSPKQLGPVLFEKLELKPAKKTKTGYATGADVLEKLIGKHPIIEKILEYRQLAKLKSTYCDGLSAVVGDDGKIHSMFNQTVTVTGRLSSTEPNLQNIPARTELGREIRKMFVAKNGRVLLDADYSQIELRILAHLANDEVMTGAYQRGEDIHAVTASQVFDVPLGEVTSYQRSFAKTVNFGIVYGMGEFSLAQELGISVKEAKKYISGYWEKYSGIREFMNTTKEKAKQDGFVKTLFGRIRYIPELRSPNFNIRSFGERAASNAPIQGTAADIIKIAMVRVHRRLKDEGLDAKLILQVHDELILELAPEELDAAKAVLREEMENAAELRVPLLVEMSCGKSWYDAK